MTAMAIQIENHTMDMDQSRLSLSDSDHMEIDGYRVNEGGVDIEDSNEIEIISLEQDAAPLLGIEDGNGRADQGSDSDDDDDDDSVEMELSFRNSASRLDNIIDEEEDDEEEENDGFHGDGGSFSGSGKYPRSGSARPSSSRSYVVGGELQIDVDDDEDYDAEEERKSKDDEVYRTSSLSPLDRFRKAGRQVKFMCGVQLSLNKCAEEAGKGTFSIQIADLMEKMSRTPSVVYIPENSTERLSFNATDYRSKYEFTWPEKARAVLQKAPADRTAEDIRLVRSLMRGLYSFRKYSSVLQDLICKVIRYAKYGRRRVVVRKGHPGFSFYFIFSGSVGVTLEEDEMNAFVKKEVNILKKGASFGEIALIKDTRRKATVVCLQDTEFLVVDADEFFDNNLHLHIQQEFEYRLDFLSRMKIFSTWATENLEEISDMGRLEEYCNESLIVKDARNTDWLLIITKGRADVLKLVDLAQLYMSKQAEEEEVIQMSRKARVLSGRSVTMWSDDIGSKVMQHQQQQQQQRQQMLQDQDRERGGQRATTGASRAGLESQRKTSAKGSTVNGRRRPKTTGQIASRMRTPTDNEVDDDDNERRIRSRSATVRLKEPDKRVLSPGEDEDDDEDVELEESGTSRSRPRTGTASHRTTSEPSDETPCRLPDYITLGLETIKAPGVDAGVYIQVDALRPGDCFGIQGVLGHMPHLSVVSHGCELIRISMSKFREYADEETLNKVRESIPTYASDLELWRSFRKQNKWNNFKSGVVREVRRHAKPTGSSVRGGGADSKSSVKGSVTSDWVTNTWSRRNTGRDSVGPSTTPLPKIPTNADDEGKSPKSPRLRRRGKSGLSSAATTRPNSRAQSRAASTRYTESRPATRQSFSQHDLKVLERRRSSMPAARLASASQSFGYQSLSHAQSMVGGATGGSMGMGGERQLNARSSMPHMHIPDLASFTKPTYTSSRSWRELKS